jgi:hypothetical protein
MPDFSFVISLALLAGWLFYLHKSRKETKAIIDESAAKIREQSNALDYTRLLLSEDAQAARAFLIDYATMPLDMLTEKWKSFEP